MDMRDAFFTELHQVAASDPDILILSNDFGAPSLDRFREELPRQFINAAISEQNMVSTAAGLAKSGKRVLVYSIATFATLRALEQVKIDLCVMNQPVAILGVGAGYAYSTDGPTHHATEDISVMRALANMAVISPADSVMAAALGRTFASGIKGPTYLRFDRGKWPALNRPDSTYDAGMSVVRAGDKVALVASGIMVHRALEVAAALLPSGLSVRVIDLYRIKPIDHTVLRGTLEDIDAVVTLEEHTANGGLGGAVAEAMADAELYRPLKRIAIRDDLLFAYGPRDRLHRERRLDRDGAAADISAWLGRR